MSLLPAEKPGAASSLIVRALKAFSITRWNLRPRIIRGTFSTATFRAGSIGHYSFGHPSRSGLIRSRQRLTALSFCKGYVIKTMRTASQPEQTQHAESFPRKFSRACNYDYAGCRLCQLARIRADFSTRDNRATFAKIKAPTPLTHRD